MQISEQAKHELRKIFVAEFGDGDLEFSDEETEKLGILFLELTAISLKRKFDDDG